ncbi:MAG TPA: A/G-specific adenine glycosylase [Polyangiaceae bacterium]|nr:A/G-specific adenine glycosylase [Polyangiaceae bacterium]
MTRLLAWYDRNRRELPWRGVRDPYAVWVSEVMLQQTQVSTVLGYYAAWMRRFPSVRALAAAREADVMHAWQGLGYYSRARRLQAGARAVVERHGGKLPQDRASLLTLPGIGAYSAGAIASIAFGAREPLVDGNVVRVLTRRFGLRGDPGKGALKKRLWALAGELVPGERPGDFNQALMELGATVCTPRAPNCKNCPWSEPCEARRRGLVEVLPELPPRAAPTRVRVALAVVRDRGRVLVLETPEDAPRWAGLWTFPHVELSAKESAEAAAERAARDAGLVVRVGEQACRLEHTITRFRITIEAFEATLVPAAAKGARPKGARRTAWVTLGALGELAMPAPHRKLAVRLAGQR